MRRGEAAILQSVDTLHGSIQSLRESVEQGFREVAADMHRLDEPLRSVETTIVNLAADFRIHTADGHAHPDE